MNRYLNICTLFLLLVNAVGALYGGLNLMVYPDGSGLGMPLSLLQYTSFKTFLLPGLILLLVNGLFGLFVFISVLKKRPQATNLVMIQGLLLTGWILMQIIMLRMIFVFHPIMLTIGILLIIMSLLQRQGQMIK